MVSLRGPALGPLISLLETRQLPPITIWIPFVRAFNNRVKTLVLYRLTAFVLDGTPTSVFGVRALWGCKLSVISRSPMLAS